MIKVMLKTLTLIFVLSVSVFFSFYSMAQDAELGMEYLKAGEYAKAKTIFQKLARNKENVQSIYKPYLQTLIKLKEWEDAEKFIKKQIKNSDGAPRYEVDLGKLYEQNDKKEEAARQYGKAIEKVKSNEEEVIGLMNYFAEQMQYNLAVETLKASRTFLKSENKYSMQLAKLYRAQGKTAEMIEEYLNFGLSNDNREIVQNLIQDDLKEEKDIELFEKTLYEKVQKYPNEAYYSEFLIWHLIQKKEFYKAFVQARALDRRYKREGSQVNDLGFLAFQNKDYTNSGKIFEYLVKEYPKNQNYPLWRRMLITSKEEVIKTTYPINQQDIRLLIAEYSKLLDEVGINARTLDALRNKALLYAFYLNEKDTAVAVLTNAIKLGTADQIFVDKCKLDLGDIYLLKSEPWEATLIYSQVEKSEKDSPLGYDAKLRNAKLNYFRGDFELSKEVLDILKQATTREIANDAMQLSLLIQDNTGMDSTEMAMKAYASVELLLFQNRTSEAIDELTRMLAKYEGHSLTDEVLFLRAKTYLKLGDVQNAMKDLETIRQKFSTDILGDDAEFNLAKIYEEKLKQPDKAIELYRELLQKYPGSIYGSEARKKIRNLRGDAIN